MARRGVVMVLSGPSGVGKGAVHTGLRERLPNSRLSVSATTRAPRAGERHLIDYEFVDDAGFDRLVAENLLLEHATYADNRYGTPRAQVDGVVERGQVVVLDIDVQGALQVRSALPDALLVFLAPPSIEELERRLRERGTEDDEEIRRRLEHARTELDFAEKFDAVVVNDDLERCVDELVSIIERRREPFDG